jgi:hypothetical protein
MSSATGFERALPEMGFGQAPVPVVADTLRTDGSFDVPMHETDAKLIRLCAIAAYAVITTVLALIGVGIALLV